MTYSLLQVQPSVGIQKWTFNAQALVLIGEVQGHIADLEVSQQGACTLALGDVIPGVTEFSRTMSGGEISYLWKSATGKQNYSLGRATTQVLQADGSYLPSYKWSFTTIVSVTQTELRNNLGFLEADVKAKAEAAIELPWYPLQRLMMCCRLASPRHRW